MKPNIEQLLLHSVHMSNILPLTSACNVRCIFCSNQQNPSGIETFKIPAQKLGKIKELIQFIDPNKKIVIGESVTRINEGEPLTHPYFKEIIQMIREQYPKTFLQITTNGILLREEIVELLASAGKVEINVSLNSSSIINRNLLMGVKQESEAMKAVKFLKEHDIPFHGSVVAMPHITGWDDLHETIGYLQEWGAITTRVFLPGYTKLAQGKMMFPNNLWREIQEFVLDLRSKFEMPITCDPPEIDNLQALVEGVLLNSPAKLAGIRHGDIIRSINGEKVFSRVDAFNLLREAGGHIKVILSRGNREYDVTVKKDVGETSGIVMSYDIARVIIEEIVDKAKARNFKKVLVMTSGLGKNVIKEGLAKVESEIDFVTREVPNNYFGGSIKSAGLLVVNDFILSLENVKNLTNHYDAVFIPKAPFDFWGRDLTGTHYIDLINRFQVAVEIV